MSEYNYENFPLDMEVERFKAFAQVLKVGQQAPDRELIDARDGSKVMLSEYWSEGPVMVEFGSITWPYCGLAAPDLEPMAEEFAKRGIKFVFIYTSEAHPSDDYPAHKSIEQKLKHASDMVEHWNIKRPMLVDNLEGSAHSAFGMLPNMTYVMAAGGTILYRADWTDERTIRIALEQIMYERTHRRNGTRVTPFYVEWLPSRANDRGRFLMGLHEIGERAVDEFIAAVEHSEGTDAADLLREIRANMHIDATADWEANLEKIRREYPDIAPAGPIYARAVLAGGTLYVSGCTARGTDAEGGPALDQLKVTLDRVVGVVKAEGGKPEDIVKLTTYVTSMEDWYPISSDQEAIYNGHFSGQNPANTLVEISGLALPGLNIEIEAIAILD